MGRSKDKKSNEDIEMGRQGGFKSKNNKDHDLDEFETDYRPVNWKAVFFTPKYIPLWIVAIIAGILTALVSLKHEQVVEALRPISEKIRDIPAGWLIFIAVLFIISFPPLFGHELVGLLAGVVYGLWIGFGVVAAGTFIGEIGTWFAFKKVLRKKAEKMERTNLTYGAMAQLCRDGGFWIVFIIRFSIIPSHISTAVFSTCDVNFWHFFISTFLTLPKQLIIVYLGVLLVNNKDGSPVKYALFGIAGLVTVLAGVWLWHKMRKIKVDLIRQQELRRKEKEDRMQRQDYSGSGSAGAAQQPPMGTYPSESQQAYETYRRYEMPQTNIRPGANGDYDQGDLGNGKGYQQSTPYPEEDNGQPSYPPEISSEMSPSRSADNIQQPRPFV